MLPCDRLNRLRHRSGGILSSKEHGMGSQHTEFHRSACTIDARGTLTAMDDLTGGETDRVEILRAMELTRDDARAGAFLGDQVNVVLSKHDDQDCSVLVVDRYVKLSQFGVGPALPHG